MSFYKTNSPVHSHISFPQLVLQSLEILLAKVIELTYQINSISRDSISSQPKASSSLINIHERKNIPNVRKSDNNIPNIRHDLEGMLTKLNEFKNSSPSLDKNIIQSDIKTINSF